MLAPYLLGIGLMVLLPIGIAGAIAFTDLDALTQPRWSGLANFDRLRSDPEFWNGLRASLALIGMAVPLRLLGALATATPLHRPGRGVGATRVAVFLPTVVPDVAYALLWLYILNPLSARSTGCCSPGAAATASSRRPG
jgi:multiple sugar transport system permease protein